MASMKVLSSLLRTLTLTSLAALLSPAFAAVDEEALLDQEAEPAELGADDTSLLQTSIRMGELEKKPATSLHITASIMNPNATAFYDLDPRPGDMPDVPEASWGWALYQHVPPGPVQLPLANDTELEPPGAGQYTAAELRAAGIGVDKPSYKGPNPPNLSLTPEWYTRCMGKELVTTNFSGQILFATAVPQIVEFVVHRDHPNRSDVSVVIAPGGGGVFSAWEAEGTDVAKWLNLLGISAFVVKYRVPAPDLWPKAAAVMDAQRAISMVRRLAPQLGLNSSRVGLFGASHGGWLSLMTAFSPRRQYEARDSVDELSPKPDFLLLLYPELNMQLMSRAISPIPIEMIEGLEVTDLSNPPPMFIANGADDACCRPEMLYMFHSMLRRRGDPTVEINIYDGIGHGFSSCFRMQWGGMEAMQHESCMWMMRARRFIMWHVERRAPPDVEAWWRRMQKFETSLLVTNTSGEQPGKS